MAEYYTVVFQYCSDDGDPTEVPPFFADRVVSAMEIFAEKGWGLDIRYGTAEKKIVDMVKE